MYRFTLPTWEEAEGRVLIGPIGVVVGDQVWVGRTVAVLGFLDEKVSMPIESTVNGIVEQVFIKDDVDVLSGQLLMLVRTEM